MILSHVNVKICQTPTFEKKIPIRKKSDFSRAKPQNLVVRVDDEAKNGNTIGAWGEQHQQYIQINQSTNKRAESCIQAFDALKVIKFFRAWFVLNENCNLDDRSW